MDNKKAMSEKTSEHRFNKAGLDYQLCEQRQSCSSSIKDENGGFSYA
jgi:hypothetical protein